MPEIRRTKLPVISDKHKILHVKCNCSPEPCFSLNFIKIKNILFRFSLVQVDKSIYAVGGCNNDDGNLTSVARYIEGDEDWEDVAELPKALRYSSCFCLYVANKCFIVFIKLTKVI